MISLSTMNSLELLQLNARIGEELRSRKVVRTGNLTGCYAEHLFAHTFGWVLARNSKSGFDAMHECIRYQIKSRRPTSLSPSRQLGEFSKFEERRFDKLAAVIFAEDFTVLRAAILDYDTVARVSKVVLGRQRLILDEWVWREHDVEDVTERLRAAQREIP